SKYFIYQQLRVWFTASDARKPQKHNPDRPVGAVSVWRGDIASRPRQCLSESPIFRRSISIKATLRLDPSGLDSSLKAQFRHCEAVLRACIRIADSGLCLLQLGLAKLDNGTQSKLIPRLRQVERYVGLSKQLAGHRHTL